MRHTDYRKSTPQALPGFGTWLVAVLLGILALTLQTEASGPQLRMDAGGHHVLSGELAKGLVSSRKSQLRPAAPTPKVRDKNSGGTVLAGPADFPLTDIVTVSPLPATDIAGPGLLYRYFRTPRAPPSLHA